MSRGKNLGRSVVAIWVINVLCVLAGGMALVIFWEKTLFAPQAVPIPTRAVLATLPPSVTLEVTFLRDVPATSLPVIASQTSSPVPPSVTASATRQPSITPYVHITDTPTVLPWMQGPLIIGYSVSGRPLELYRFGTGSTQRMIVAGIHGGGEWNTIALADELIAHLADHPELVPENITLYILRNLNPDGEARAHSPEGRTNDHGVDLNRNFPANWQADWDRDGCWVLLPTTSGAYAGSEPETVALMIFIQQHKIDALISYHSAALGIFPGGLPPDKASIKLARELAAVSNYPYPPVDTGCEYTGTLADWASSKDIAAVDLELTDHTHTDFDQNLRILEVFLQWKR